MPARDHALNVFKRETLKPKFGEETVSVYHRKALQPRDDIALDSYPKQTSRPNIMLVDDEPDILTVFKSYLASEGYLVEVFLTRIWHYSRLRDQNLVIMTY